MTTKALILNYLKARQGYVSGMELEDQARAWQTKASTISRRARELVEDGKIEVTYGAKHTAQYRSKQPTQTFSNAKSISWLGEI